MGATPPPRRDTLNTDAGSPVASARAAAMDAGEEKGERGTISLEVEGTQGAVALEGENPYTNASKVVHWVVEAVLVEEVVVVDGTRLVKVVVIRTTPPVGAGGGGCTPSLLTPTT